jgi:hypothetical protein
MCARTHARLAFDGDAPHLLGMRSSAATSSAKLIRNVATAHVTGGTPALLLSRTMSLRRGAAQRVLVATDHSRPAAWRARQCCRSEEKKRKW